MTPSAMTPERLNATAMRLLSRRNLSDSAVFFLPAPMPDPLQKFVDELEAAILKAIDECRIDLRPQVQTVSMRIVIDPEAS